MVTSADRFLSCYIGRGNHDMSHSGNLSRLAGSHYCWLLSFSASSAWGLFSPSLTALRKPLMALPTSLPSPRRRLVPNSVTTISRMIRSCQILMPIISSYSLTVLAGHDGRRGCLGWSLQVALHYVAHIVHIALLYHVVHVTVLRRCSLLQKFLVDLVEVQHRTVVLRGQCLGGSLVGEGREGRTHGALQWRAGYVPGFPGVDQMAVVGLIPLTLAHVMHIESGIQNAVLRLQPPAQHFRSGAEFLHLIALHCLAFGAGEVRDDHPAHVALIGLVKGDRVQLHRRLLLFTAGGEGEREQHQQSGA